MKKYFLLLSVFVFLISCSKDDTNNQTPNAQTFLERVDGQGFIDSYGTWEDYWFFSDSQDFLKLVELDTSNGETWCSVWREGSNNADGETLEIKIVSNTFASLLLEIKWSGDTTWDRIEFSLNESGSSLIYREDFGDPNDVEYFPKTSRKYSELCND